MSDTDNSPPEGNDPPSDIRPISIAEEMKRSYLDYAMSVIVSRALPDARDGLKPVHRRILYSMHENGHTPDKKYVKSARVVGDVMGKYHPHGDQAIYDALVRMAQDFSMRLPLIDGQGNYGSVDGDPPAAMRYTECRLADSAMSLLEDIDKDTVDFQANYDGNEREPVVLPARFPNLLANGAGGIAVGMATNIPPHNLGELIDACVALIDNPALSIEELIGIIPGPDFPTGGVILGHQGIRAAYHTGRGSIVMRGKVEIEVLRGDREAIIISEIPYQVNKAAMVERIGELWREKKIDGISALRDESDRQGYRVVIELRREAVADIVLNQLYRFTALQSTFGANMVALDGGRPLVMNLKDLLTIFLAFREEVISRRTKYPARQGARPRPHPRRARDRGGQYRRSDQDDPRLEGRQRGARSIDGQGMAGRHRGIADCIDRRSTPPRLVGRDCPADRRAGEGDPRPAAAAAHCTRPRRDQGRARQARRGDRGLSRHPALARAHPVDRQGRAGGGAEGIRHAAPDRHPRPGRRDGG